ncbi:hypothetical protein RRF57_009480 [Xylaria bambusicola]|uniref:Uncharacterized protein n=1 Tax=Xylaria bambusicola TaxID=326684 RepID=A0AAN7UVM7_9PEZI
MATKAARERYTRVIPHQLLSDFADCLEGDVFHLPSPNYQLQPPGRSYAAHRRLLTAALSVLGRPDRQESTARIEKWSR